MRLANLADELRNTVGPYGVRVIEVAGWQTRGQAFTARPSGAVRHWTAGPRVGYAPSLKTVTVGRPDLPGPLCHLYQARNLAGPDDLYVIASGRANHAGAGSWSGLKGGNSLTTGLEIEWSGPDEPFPDLRRLVSELAIATLIRLGAGDPGLACEHREWADPKGRKIDTNLPGGQLRRRVAEINAPKPPPPPPDEDPMTSSPAVTFVGIDRYAAIHGQDHRAWLRIGAGDWAPFDGSGGRPNSALDPGSSPSIAVGPAMLPRLWVSGANRKLHFTDRQPAGHWSAWDAFDGYGGLPGSLLAPGSSPDAYLAAGLWVVLVTGDDRKVYQYAEQGSGGWHVSALGGGVA